MGDLTTSTSVTIRASGEDVWKALTTPELIKRWFFGVDTETDWKVGSPLVHRGQWDGRPYEDKGTIVRIDPPRVLVHTHWSPLSGKPDRAENYQQVTWRLSDRKGATELTITEANLPSEDAKAVSEQAWRTVLGNLRQMLETEEGLRKTA
jgi:uncharacterized protein YndB with AHSA1/START domain